MVNKWHSTNNKTPSPMPTIQSGQCRLLWTLWCLTMWSSFSTYTSLLPPSFLGGNDSGLPTCPNCCTTLAFAHDVAFPLLCWKCLFSKACFKHALLHEAVSDHRLNVLFLSLQNADSVLLGIFFHTLWFHYLREFCFHTIYSLCLFASVFFNSTNPFFIIS